MLVSDSMPLLWLIYMLLSLVVLATGYMGIRFLPLLPRLAITGAVAGVLWMPIRFQLPLVEEGEFYTGLAPAVLIAAISFLQKDYGLMSSAVALLLVGISLGTAMAIGLWWWLRKRSEPAAVQRDEAPKGGDKPAASKRREPVIG